MPYCPKCGKPAPPKSAYCPVCGTNIPHEDFLEPTAAELPLPPKVPPEPPPIPMVDPFAEVSPEPPPMPKPEMEFPFPTEPMEAPFFPPPLAPTASPQQAPPKIIPLEPEPPFMATPASLEYPSAIPSAPPVYPSQPAFPPQQSMPGFVPPTVSAPTPPPTSAPPWRNYEPAEPTRPSPRYEEPYSTRHAYDSYDIPIKRSYGGVWAIVVFVILGILAVLYFGGVFNTTPPPNPQEDYKKVYASAAAAVQTKNATALYTILSTTSRNTLDTLLPKEKRLNSSLDDKSDSTNLIKLALEKGDFAALFPSGDQPENIKELEGGRVSLSTQQGKTFWLSKEGENWKLDIEPSVFGFEARRYLVLDAWDKISEIVKAKNGNDLYDQMDKASKDKAEEEAKLPPYPLPKQGQNPKPRPKTGPAAFKNGRELLVKSLAEAKDLPDPTTLKIQKLEFKDSTATITLTNGSLVVLKEENSFWKLDLLYDGGPPVVLLGQTALLASGKGAPQAPTTQTSEKPSTETGDSSENSSSGGKYAISGTATVTGDSGGGRSGYAISDKINGNFNNRVKLGLITATPSKVGTATASFTIGKDGSVYGVNISSSNGDLAIEIKSACLSSRFPASSNESKVSYHATVTGQ